MEERYWMDDEAWRSVGIGVGKGAMLEDPTSAAAPAGAGFKFQGLSTL